MTDAPILATWDGEAMRPASPYWAKRAVEQWVVGQKYMVDIHQERSEVTHKHEFAWLRDAWMNLPEHLADLYPSPEHLRKRALIEAGWYTETAIDCGSNAAALRVAAAVPTLDSFAHVIVRGPTALVRRARSQSHRSMNRQEFQASKSAVLEVVAEMIGVSPRTLQQNAERVT